MIGSDNHRHPASRGSMALAVSALAVVLASCSAGSGTDDSNAACPTPSPAPPDQTELLPPGLSLDEVGTVTRVESTEGHLAIHAITSKPIDEITVLIQDAVTAAGYRPAGMDNEGFEAEVFFTYGSYAAGQALVRRAECEGQWDVELVLIDPGSGLPEPPARG